MSSFLNVRYLSDESSRRRFLSNHRPGRAAGAREENGSAFALPC